MALYKEVIESCMTDETGATELGCWVVAVLFSDAAVGVVVRVEP
jgi:hypothetical protein